MRQPSAPRGTIRTEASWLPAMASCGPPLHFPPAGEQPLSCEVNMVPEHVLDCIAARQTSQMETAPVGLPWQPLHASDRRGCLTQVSSAPHGREVPPAAPRGVAALYSHTNYSSCVAAAGHTVHKTLAKGRRAHCIKDPTLNDPGKRRRSCRSNNKSLPQCMAMKRPCSPSPKPLNPFSITHPSLLHTVLYGSIHPCC